MAFPDYSITPSANTEIGDGIYIGPNMARDDVREALQTLAADGKGLYLYAKGLIDLAQGEQGPPGTVTNNAFWTTLEEHGAVGDGDPATGTGTDDSAALVAALNYLAANGGGTLLVAPKTYRLHNFEHTLADNGDPNNYGVSSMMPIRIVGSGAHAAGEGDDPQGGSIFLFTGSGTGKGPRIFGEAQGKFESTGVTYYSKETGDGRAFLHFAATTPKVHHNCFWTDKTGNACDDDPIHFGGNTLAIPWTGVNAPFQGYGGAFTDNFSNGVRKTYQGMYANAVTVRSNVWWNRCGSNEVVKKAIHINANATDAVGGVVNTALLDATPITLVEEFVTGCTIDDNLIEIGNYHYGVDASRMSGTSLKTNQGYDQSGTTLAVVHLDADCEGNTVVSSVANGGMPYLIDDNPSANNAFISGLKEFRSQIPQLLTGIDEAKPTEIKYGIVTGNAGLLVKPDNYFIQSLIRLQESDAAPSNAGATVFQVSNTGLQNLSGTQAGNVTNAETNSMQVTDNGRTMTAPGKIKFVSTADYVEVHAARLNLQDAAGTGAGALFNNGNQVVGARGAAVGNAVNAVSAPNQTEFNNFVGQFNALLQRLRDHGLIAT